MGKWAESQWPYCAGCGVEMEGRRRRYHNRDCQAEAAKARARPSGPRRKTGPKPRGKLMPCEVCGVPVYRRPNDVKRYKRAYCPDHVGQQLQRQRTRVCKCGCGGYPEPGKRYVEGHKPEPMSPEEKQAALRLNRRRQAVRRYGLTLATYDWLLESQGGGCAICGKTPEEEGKNLAIDHDHACCPQEAGSCGLCVRGILCDSCTQRVVVHERADRSTTYPDVDAHLRAYAVRGSPLDALLAV